VAESKWITNVNIKCDKCDWSKAIQWSEAKDWHNVLCPKCKDCIIVNDEDLAVINMMQFASDIQDELPAELTQNAQLTRIDTAPMRKE
jgi:phage FluMu protein Com